MSAINDTSTDKCLFDFCDPLVVFHEQFCWCRDTFSVLKINSEQLKHIAALCCEGTGNFVLKQLPHIKNLSGCRVILTRVALESYLVLLETNPTD